MANFDESYRLLLPREGGYALVAGDKGGETYKGIARKYWPTWSGWPIIDAIKAVRPIRHNEEIHDYNLKLNVKFFYKKNFWDKMYGNAIKSQGIADILFDSYVLMGANAIMIAQRILKDLGFVVDVDGAVGTKETLPALNNVNQELFYRRFKEARAAYHQERVQKEPGQAKFLKGWLNRVASFPDALKKKSLA